MRISVDLTDPGFDNWRVELVGRMHVFLNGVRMKDVVTADSTTGEVVVFKRTADGGYYQMKPGKFEVARETLTGEVRIEFDEGFAPL